MGIVGVTFFDRQFGERILLTFLVCSFALRLVPLKLAGQAVAKSSYVYLFLIGMMLLSELAREQRVFDWVASVAVRGHTNGAAIRSKDGRELLESPLP